jgi:GH15 family glucan-1,4-alpha-glucosidase
MPRDIPVGNGKLLLCFDREYRLRELCFPHVGQENHIQGKFCRLGLWTEGRFSWVGPEWRKELRYVSDTMVTKVSLHQPEMELSLVCRDAVDFHEDVYLKEISVENLASRPREVRLFFHLDFGISGNDLGDTAGFDPKTCAVIHYKGPRYFLISGLGAEGAGLSQYAVGQKGLADKEGTFRDAEDGLLSGNLIAQGSVDSVACVSLTIGAESQGTAFFWIAAGFSWYDVQRLDSLVKYKHPQKLIKRTEDYWRLWIRKESPPLELLPEKLTEFYYRSLLIIRTQIDSQGGILAANDSDIIYFNRDTYSYVWPRDGALVAHALDLAGHPTASKNFFRFISQLLQPEGCLLHKFNPDGTLASSWHPWSYDGKPQLPIQEDSTALVIWALWHHFVLYRDLDFIKPLYRPLVKKAADFMCQYRDEQTGLPAPCFDLWEERRGIFSFTVGAVFGGLTAASLFCKVFGEDNKAAQYQQIAAGIRDAASKNLWREDIGRFCRMLYPNSQGEFEVDATCDSSLWGLFAFGMYGADDPRVSATMEALRERLWAKTSVGGMARYENDSYQRVNPEVTGNPWLICTLWLADYLIEKANSDDDLVKAQDILTWVTNQSLPSGVLGEQIDPFSGEPRSISPLTWSHAAYITTTHRLLRRLTAKRSLPESPGRREDWVGRLYNRTCDAIHGLCKIEVNPIPSRR